MQWFRTYSKWTRYLYMILASTIYVSVQGQCEGYTDDHLSPKIANYIIHADLDREHHIATCNQSVVWTNTSPNQITELRFYMYMNAFKNTKSTYLRGMNSIFGENITELSSELFGYIEISHMKVRDGADLTKSMDYIRPDDDNTEDYSVLSVALDTPLAAGKSITIDMDFEVKLPKTIVRSGYGKNGFHLFVHWFPQLGVYEQDRKGDWGWNCHQFMQKTEFYADFGNYDVTVVTDQDFVVGGSGCRVSETIDRGKKTTRFIAYDIIDFGWTAYPLFETYTDTWQDVDIEILIPSEHCAMAPRYMDIIKKALTYLDEHVGKYYYPKITIVDPPMHTLRSGFMEYPMMITCASVYGTPKQFRGSESLAIHEFTHMYFMGMLASNEKEEAWLDEGFVTFYEDEILDHYYGEQGSFFDFGGFRTGNAQKSRQEYTTLDQPDFGVIAVPGWENRGYYKALVYGKTATTLRTFKNIIGPVAFERLMKYYFDKNKFTHPREEDWLAAVDTCMRSISDELSFDALDYFHKALHTSKILDFELVSIENGAGTHQVHVRNNGGFDISTEVNITLENGDTQSIPWDGKGEKVITISNASLIKSAYIDQDHKVLLDLNYINNSITLAPKTNAPARYGGHGAAIGEVIYHIISFLL